MRRPPCDSVRHLVKDCPNSSKNMKRLSGHDAEELALFTVALRKDNEVVGSEA